MKKENEALKEIGKGLIAFANLFTGLSIINLFVLKDKFDVVVFAGLVYVFIALYIAGYLFIKKGAGK